MYFMEIMKNGRHFGYNFQIQKYTPVHQMFKDAAILSKFFLSNIFINTKLSSQSAVKTANSRFKLF